MFRGIENLEKHLAGIVELNAKKATSMMPAYQSADYSEEMKQLRKYMIRHHVIKGVVGSALVGGTGYFAYRYNTDEEFEYETDQFFKELKKQGFKKIEKLVR